MMLHAPMHCDLVIYKRHTRWCTSRRPSHNRRLMFVLLAVLFSVGSFTDPARKALTPQLVPQHELHLAATLDAFTWSLMVRTNCARHIICSCWFMKQHFKWQPHPAATLDAFTCSLMVGLAQALYQILLSLRALLLRRKRLSVPSALAGVLLLPQSCDTACRLLLVRALAECWCQL